MFCPRCHWLAVAPSQRFCPHDGSALCRGARLGCLPIQPTELEGEVLGGRYTIRGFIGCGGMAQVYLAEVAGEINHPNIVKVLDAGERADRSPYLVLEFLFGESLGDLLRREGKVAPAFALPLLRKVASALAEAHKAGIIHRDIKPDNLFLVGERSASHDIKVLDFGLAKLLGSKTVIGIGRTAGTLPYMAPEQALTDEVDGRTDVYSLGMVMFKMLTGKVPFDMRNSMTVIAHHLFVPPPRPSQLCPGMDPRLEAVILKALRKRPEDRYPSMDALLCDIERLMGERSSPLLASPPRYDAAEEYVPVTEFARESARMYRGRLKGARTALVAAHAVP